LDDYAGNPFQGAQPSDFIDGTIRSGLGQGGVYFPRAMAELVVVIGGVQETLHLPPKRVKLARRSHSHPTTCEIDFDGAFFRFDTNTIESSFVTLFMADAGGPDNEIEFRENIHFVGDGELGDGEDGDEVPVYRMKFKDLSFPLRDHKPLAPVKRNGSKVDPMPHYSDDLGTAIKRILDFVPDMHDDEGNPRVLLRNTEALQYSLAQLTGKRNVNAPIPLQKSDMSAWEVIEFLCAIAGRSVNIVLNELVVRKPEEAFGDPGEKVSTTDEAVAHFIFNNENANTSKVSRSKKFIRRRKGIRVIAFDDDTCTRIEKVWPRDNAVPLDKHMVKGVVKSIGQDAREQVKAAKAKGKPKHRNATGAAPAHVIEPPDRDVFYLRAVHTPDAVLEYAKLVWKAIGSQECEIKLSTPVWDAVALRLQNGNRVTVEVEPVLTARLRDGSDSDAVAFLVDELGCEEGYARLAVRAARVKTSNLWYVKDVDIDYSDSGVPNIELSLINLIEVPVLT